MKLVQQDRRLKTSKEVEAAVRKAAKVKPYREQTALTTLPDGRKVITTCQVCGFPARANEGLIAPHGFEREEVDGRKYGRYIGTGCAGGRHPPYEYGRDALEAHIRDIDGTLDRMRKERNGLSKNTAVILSYKVKGRRKEDMKFVGSDLGGATNTTFLWYGMYRPVDEFTVKAVKRAMDKAMKQFEDYRAYQVERLNIPRTMGRDVMEALLERSNVVRTAATAKAWRKRR